MSIAAAASPALDWKRPDYKMLRCVPRTPRPHLCWATRRSGHVKRWRKYPYPLDPRSLYSSGKLTDYKDT